MPPNKYGKYRDYSDEDIDRIWSIKLLQGVGYSLTEIRELMDNPEADFYKSISEKVVELERKRDDITNFIKFAKTIKLTGSNSNTKEVWCIGIPS
jgi:DNA-binding transcriptional MerR regulator